MQESSKNLFKYILICSIVIAPALVIRFFNVVNFNLFRGFDALAHLQYIIYIAKNMTLPPVALNLETYQPPLYYVVSSIIWNFSISISEKTAFIALKSFSTILGLLSIIISLMIIRVVCDFKKTTYLFLLTFILYLPMNIYVSPMIGNEMMSCFLICLTTYLFVKIVKENIFSIKQALILGSLCGLALLTKYTGLTVFMTIILSCVIISAKRNVMKFLMVFLTTVLVISGWWYTRNIILYKAPFIKSNDIRKFQSIYKNQPPGKHSLKDFVLFDTRIFAQPLLALDNDFKNFITKDMRFPNYNKAYNSILSGTFATIWIENHGLFLKHDSNTFKKAKILLLLAIVPTFLILFGFLIVIKNAFTRKNTYLLPLIMIALFSVAGYIFYNIKYPYFCHIKSFFLIHLLPTIAISYGYGIVFFKKHSKIFLILIGLDLFAVYILVISLYFY